MDSLDIVVDFKSGETNTLDAVVDTDVKGCYQNRSPVPVEI
jgi:hypothetical protein